MKRIIKRSTRVKRKRKRCPLLSQTILFIFLSLQVTISSLFASGIGTTGAQFLKIGVGARPVGMGSCFVAVADDVNTAYWNPSGFSQIKGTELTTMYLSWFEGMNYGYIGYAQSCKKGLGFGGALAYLTTGDIPQTSMIGENKGAFEGEDIAGIFSVGKSFDEKFSVGANVKIIQQKIETESASGYAFDVGTLYQVNQKANLGMAIQNIGPKIKFITESDALPLNWKIGGSYKLFDKNLTLALDINFPSDNKINEHMGAEYLIGSLIALRLGYRTDTVSYLGTESGLSAGMGLKLTDYSLDYAWVPYGDLGKTHRVSLLIKF